MKISINILFCTINTNHIKLEVMERNSITIQYLNVAIVI